MSTARHTVTESTLQSALRDDELVLYHQPTVCLLRGKVIGSEALVRWLRDDGELIPPDQFIPLAERSGQLSQITERMLDLSIAAIARTAFSHPGLTLSMNVTPSDLESHRLSRLIKEHIAAGRLNATELAIEITESIAMADFDRVHDDLVELNRLGIRVLMDDFGTGYSSIDRLSRLPFSSLKLDRGVVQRMGSSKQNLDVVKSSISMARELRMTSVAEGVESEGAYNFLVANGCEQAQGYWISQPLTLDGFDMFLSDHRSFEGSQIGRVHQAIYNLLHFRKSLIDAAYCCRLSSDQVLDSVIDPEVALDICDSRFGTWYYGIGRCLQRHPAYAQIETPFIAAHACGQHFMQLLQAGVDHHRLLRSMSELDQHMDCLLTLLHSLERQLLYATD